MSNSTILFKITLAQKVLIKALDRELKENIGTSATQVAALLYLSQNNGSLHSDLSRELFQNKSATTTLVERMVKKRLIFKKKSLTDRRASQLFLTTKGKEISSMAIPSIVAYEQELVRTFSQEDLTRLDLLLSKIIVKFQTQTDNYFYSDNINLK